MCRAGCHGCALYIDITFLFYKPPLPPPPSSSPAPPSPPAMSTAASFWAFLPDLVQQSLTLLPGQVRCVALRCMPRLPLSPPTMSTLCLLPARPCTAEPHTPPSSRSGALHCVAETAPIFSDHENSCIFLFLLPAQPCTGQSYSPFRLASCLAAQHGTEL